MTTPFVAETSGSGLPPIEVSVVVAAAQERAFDLFVNQLGRWWPLQTHAIAVGEQTGISAVDVRIEPRVGGRIIETWSDGHEVSWGRVLAFEPPNRLLFEWNPNRTRVETTEVEIRFVAHGTATRIELEHRAWERLGAAAAKARGGYASGWEMVLGRFEGFVTAISTG